jgi:hypothetical protein
VVVSLGGVHLLVGCWFASLVSHLAQALVFELAESDAVLGVGDVEVEDGPDEREAAGLAGEAADHLGASFDFGERAFEQVGASPSAAVSCRVAQVNDERVEVVGEAFGGGGVAGTVELVDQRLEALLAVALVGGVVERLPVGRPDALAFAFGQLGEQVAHTVDGAVLAVLGRASTSRPALTSPGAPSATTSSGAPSPRAIRSLPGREPVPSATRASRASPPAARARPAR